MSEAQAVTLAKRILRGALRSRLREVASDELDALSKKACARMQAQHWFPSSRSISVFLSMPMAEIRTDDILSALMMSGKTCFVPKITGAERTGMSLAHINTNEVIASFPRDRWHIPDPPEEYITSAIGCSKGSRRAFLCPRSDAALYSTDGVPTMPPLDVILVPGLAFSPLGARIGHGKGYYGGKRVEA